MSFFNRDGGIHLTSDQYDTAKITLIRLEQRVGNIQSLIIRQENDIDLHSKNFYLNLSFDNFNNL